MAITQVTGSMVATNAISGTIIADNAITAVHIATNAVSGTLIADNAVTAVHIAQNSITVTQLADDAVEADKIADGVITTNHLNSAMISSQSEVTANSSDYVLIGDASDSNALKKALVSDFGNTTEQVQDIAGGMFSSNTETGITATYQDGDGTIDLVVGTLNQDTSGTAAIATTVTTADESSDTTCFPLFVTAATGNLAPKSGSNLTFNSSSGLLSTTHFSGQFTGQVTGDCSGSSLAVTQAAQTAITSVGTLTGLTVTGAFATNVPTVTLNNTTNSTWLQGFHALFPNVATGNEVSGISVGTEWDSYNASKFGFYYAGDGSTSNLLTLGLHGKDKVLTISAAGNVGIGTGTAAPGYDLHLKGTGAQQLMVENTSSSGYADVVIKSDTHMWSISTGGSGTAARFTENFYIYDHDGSEQRLVLGDAGQLGFGDGENWGTDGQVLTSAGTSAPPAWEDAGGTAMTVMQNNIAILAFQVGTTAAAFQMQDQFVDDFNDHTGIVTGSSTAYASGNDGFTVLLLSSDSSDGNQTFTDTSAGGSQTNTAYYEGDPDHSTDQAKFGATSIHLDGNDFIAFGDTADWDFGTDPFTIDMWWYPTSQGNYDRFMAGGTDADGTQQQWFFGKWPSNKFNIGYKQGSGYEETDATWGTVSNNDVWHHIAMERNGTNIYAYMDGTKKLTWDIGTSTNINTGGTMSYPLIIGQRYASGNNVEPMTGYLDEIRISKGVARYGGSNFTVETSAYGGASGYVGGGGANMTLISTTQTAQSTPTKANLVFLMEDKAGTATINTDIIAYVSRNAGSNWSSAVTLVDQGTWGTNKKILVANDIDISGLTGTTALRYKVTTHNQSGSKNTALHGASLAWA